MEAIASLDQRARSKPLVDLCDGIKEAPGIAGPELLMPGISPLIQNVWNVPGDDAASVHRANNQVMGFKIAHLALLVSLYAAIQQAQVVIQLRDRPSGQAGQVALAESSVGTADLDFPGKCEVIADKYPCSRHDTGRTGSIMGIAETYDPAVVVSVIGKFESAKIPIVILR